MKLRLASLLTAGGLWFGLSVLAPAALAADARPLNLITSPLPINLTSDPGTTTTTDIRVKQNSGQTERLKVDLMKFAAFGTDGRPRLLDRAPGDDYFDWVKFDKPVFDAPNNVWQTVKMTITLPKTAAFGYYYAVVFSREGDAVRQTGNTNAINGGSAVLVLLDAHVPGAKRQVTIDALTSLHNVYEFLPATFNVTLRNTGNVHVVPHGDIFILNSSKAQVADLHLNDEQGNILPDSRRVYPVEWTDGFPHFEKTVEDGKVKLDADKQPVMHLVWNNGNGSKDIKPHLRFGHYSAHLVAAYDDGQRDVPIEAEIAFWVIPWRLLAGAVVVIILVGVGVYSITRGTWRKASGWIRGRKATS